MATRLSRISILAAAIAVGVSAVLAPAGSARSQAARSQSVNLPTLYVAYTMSCTFAITDDSGRPVTSIAPGAYQVQVTTPTTFAEVDLTGITDMTACKSFVQFQLTGPGVSVSTTLTDGDSAFDSLPVTLRAGATYTAVDLNQPSVARVVFTTAAGGSPTAPPTAGGGTSSGKGTASTDIVGSKSKQTATSAPTPLRGTLDGTVSATGTSKLTYKGKVVTSLKAGRYTVSVDDGSKKGGFILQEIHKGATTVTGVSFVGKRSASVVLKAGQWFFYPTFVGTKTYFIVTS